MDIYIGTKKKKGFSLKRVVVSMLVLGTISAAVLFYQGQKWWHQSVELQAPIVFDFSRGTRLAQLSEQLYQKGAVANPHIFHLWVRFVRKNYPKFQAGLYRFEGELSPSMIENKLIAGEIYVPVVATITIPEGFTAKKTFERLVANGIGSMKEFEFLARDQEFLKSKRIEAAHIEGYLYPATYKFSQELPTAKAALSQMIDTFWDKVPPGYQGQVNALGLTFHKAVVFASMIELETMFDDEREKISEVIWRRLKANEPLGIDAALIYGIPDYQGDIKWAHLKDAKNPYNLRIHKGLPPSPIASPSADSLKAILNPSKFGYHYYVLQANDSGRHLFSRTMKEHNQAVKSYVNWYQSKHGQRTAKPK